MNKLTFATRLATHLASTKEILVERQALIVEAYAVASKSNNFNKVSALLNGLWDVKAYRSAQTIVSYLEAHSPMRFTYTKGNAIPFGIKLMNKAKDGTRDEYQPLVVAYNVWEKAKIEQALTAEVLIGRIDSVIKASANLNGVDLAKFELHLAHVASEHAPIAVPVAA